MFIDTILGRYSLANRFLSFFFTIFTSIQLSSIFYNTLYTLRKLRNSLQQSQTTQF